MLTIKGDLKLIFNLNKDIFPTSSLPLTLFLFYHTSQGFFRGGMKLQDLCECIKGTEHTFNTINITSTTTAESQVRPFICYHNTLVKSKSVENILFKQCCFPPEKSDTHLKLGLKSILFLYKIQRFN